MRRDCNRCSHLTAAGIFVHQKFNFQENVEFEQSHDKTAYRCENQVVSLKSALCTCIFKQLKTSAAGGPFALGVGDFDPRFSEDPF